MAINKRKILDSAQKHLQKGALEKALKDYQTLLKADPKDSNVRLKIGDIQLKRGKTDDAIGAYLKVAESFMQNGFDAKAVALYKQITKIDDKRVDVFVPLAELYERMGLQSDALKALQQAADVHYREGQKDQALDLLRRMAALDPSNTANRIKVADLLRQEDRNQEAISEYEEVASELERQGAEEDRIRILVRVLELDPERVDLMAAVGRSRIASGNFEAAEKTARMMIEQRADEPEGYELLGEAFDGLGRTEERVDAYRKAAELYRERGDDGIARDLTQRFVAPATLEDDIELDDIADDALLGDADEDLAGLDPEESDPRFDPNGMSIGNPIQDLEDLDDPAPATAPLPPMRGAPSAEDDSANEGDPDQLLAEASVYLRYGKHDRAIESLTSIVAHDPTHALAFSKLGEALAASGDAEQAMLSYERGAAAALTGGDPSTFDMIKANLAAIDPARADALSAAPSAGDSAPNPPTEAAPTEAAPTEAAPIDADMDLEPDPQIDIEFEDEGAEEAPAAPELSVELPEVEITLDDSSLGEADESESDAGVEFSIDGAAPESVEIEVGAEESSVAAPQGDVEIDVDVDEAEPDSYASEVPADFELSDPELAPDDAGLGLDEAELEFDVEEQVSPVQASADVEVAVDLGDAPELSLDDAIAPSDEDSMADAAADDAASGEISLDEEIIQSDEESVTDDVLLGDDLDAADEISLGDDPIAADEVSVGVSGEAAGDEDPSAAGAEVSLGDDLLSSDVSASASDELGDELFAPGEDSFTEGLDAPSEASDDQGVEAAEISLGEDLSASEEIEPDDDLMAGPAADASEDLIAAGDGVSVEEASSVEDGLPSDEFSADEEVVGSGASFEDSSEIEVSEPDLGEDAEAEGSEAPALGALEPLTDELDIAGSALGDAPVPEAPESASATTPAQVADDLEEADFFYQQGMHEEARAIYQRILASAPSHPQALLRVGEIDVAVGGDADAAASAASDNAVELSDLGEDLFHEDSAPVEASEAPDLGAELEDEPAEDAVETAASDESMETETSEDETDDVEPRVSPRRPTRAEADVTGPVVMDSVATEALEDDDAFDLAAQLSEVFDVEEPVAGSANLGLGSEDEGFEQVFAAFKQGVESALEDTDFEAHYDLGIAYREMGLVEDAISEFTAAMGAPERKLPSLHMMGLCALDLTRHADAVAHLEQALALPDVPADQLMAIRFDLGRAYVAQSDVERARAAFLAVQEIDPDFQDVATHLSALDDLPADDADKEEQDSAEAFENFDDLMAEDPEAEPAEAQYESFDEFMDDGDQDSETPEAAELPGEADVVEASEAEAVLDADDSVPQLEPDAEAIEDGATPDDVISAAEESLDDESEADADADPEPEGPAQAEDSPTEGPDEDAPPKKARRKKKISFV